jgi:hypothetical protein
MSYQSINSHNVRLNVPASQSLQSALSKGHKHYTQKLPASTGTVAFGSQATIYIREKNKLLTGLQLELSVSALSGLTNPSGSQFLIPSPFWLQRCDIYLGNTLIETINPLASWITSQMTSSSDAKRSLKNSAGGNAFSTSSLVTKSASAGFYYIEIPLGPWAQSGLPLISTNDLELRLTFDSVASLWGTTFGTATGTAAATINSLQAIATMVEMPPSSVEYHTSLMRRAPLHHVFLDLFSQSFTVASGTSSASLVLSSIVGNVAFLVFAIRSSNPTNANLYTFNTGLSSFQILSSGGENVVGGGPINVDLNRFIQAREWWNTTFSSDVNGVYCYSHAVDPLEVYSNGSALGGRIYSGSEQLQLSFASALGSAVQVDVYAYTYAALELSSSGAKKFAI